MADEQGIPLSGAAVEAVQGIVGVTGWSMDEAFVHLIQLGLCHAAEEAGSPWPKRTAGRLQHLITRAAEQCSQGRGGRKVRPLIDGTPHTKTRRRAKTRNGPPNTATMGSFEDSAEGSINAVADVTHWSRLDVIRCLVDLGLADVGIVMGRPDMELSRSILMQQVDTAIHGARRKTRGPGQ